MMKRRNFESILSDAIKNLTENGFSVHALKKWQGLLDLAAKYEYSPDEAQSRIQKSLTSLYQSKVTPLALAKFHPGLDRVTINRIIPSMRHELTKRIAASADLIKLNREQAIGLTLKRFSGWSTSIPEGGTDSESLKETKAHIVKPLRSLTYEERRLHIDQGHKMLAAVNEILGLQSGAICMIWRSHFRQAGYDYREDHKERDGNFYVIRGNWALERGFMKNAGHGYTDQITAPAQEVNCRCFGIYVRNLRDLPADMLTQKGKEELKRVKVS